MDASEISIDNELVQDISEKSRLCKSQLCKLKFFYTHKCISTRHV